MANIYSQVIILAPRNWRTLTLQQNVYAHALLGEIAIRARQKQDMEELIDRDGWISDCLKWISPDISKKLGSILIQSKIKGHISYLKLQFYKSTVMKGCFGLMLRREQLRSSAKIYRREILASSSRNCRSAANTYGLILMQTKSQNTQYYAWNYGNLKLRSLRKLYHHKAAVSVAAEEHMCLSITRYNAKRGPKKIAYSLRKRKHERKKKCHHPQFFFKTVSAILTKSKIIAFVAEVRY